MTDKQQFLIFSLARSGSTALAGLVNELEDRACSIEPFSPDYVGTYYREVLLRSGLPSALDSVLSDFRGIKHVWHPDGWPFANLVNGNIELLRLFPGKILLLYRRNILRRLASEHIAHSSRIWHIKDLRDVHARDKAVYKPMDVEHVKSQLKLEAEGGMLQSIITDLKSQHKDVIYVEYEQIWEDGTEDARMDRLLDILEAMDVDLSNAIWRQKILSTIRLSEHLCAKKYYTKIPNYQEIDRLFGSNRTGFLFDEVYRRE